MRLLQIIVSLVLALPAYSTDADTPPASPDARATRLPENKLDLPPDTKVPDGFSKLSPDGQREWLRGVWRRPRENAQASKDKAELVRPAPKGFTPDGKEKSFKLTLFPLKTQLRPGESFWYRFELQNIGSSTVTLREQESFFKSGYALGYLHYDLYLTLPDSTEVKGLSHPFSIIGHCPGNPGPKVIEAVGGTEEDFKDEFLKATADSSIARELAVTLEPGETIVTRPWRFVDSCMPKAPTSAEREALAKGYREWPWDRERRRPGIYSIRIEMNDSAPAKPPTEEEMAAIEKKDEFSRKSQLLVYEMRKKFALGRVSSNSVRVTLSDQRPL